MGQVSHWSYRSDSDILSIMRGEGEAHLEDLLAADGGNGGYSTAAPGKERKRVLFRSC